MRNALIVRMLVPVQPSHCLVKKAKKYSGGLHITMSRSIISYAPDAILRVSERKKWTDQDVRITAASLLWPNTISLAGPSLGLLKHTWIATREAVRWTDRASGVGVFLVGSHDLLFQLLHAGYTQHCHDRLRLRFTYLLLFEAFTLHDRSVRSRKSRHGAQLQSGRRCASLALDTYCSNKGDHSSAFRNKVAGQKQKPKRWTALAP